MVGVVVYGYVWVLVWLHMGVVSYIWVQNVKRGLSRHSFGDPKKESNVRVLVLSSSAFAPNKESSNAIA